MFAFTFCKNKPGKLLSELQNEFALNKQYCFYFRFRSVEHAVLLASFRLSKAGDNIYLHLWKNTFLDVCLSSKFANCEWTKLNALENSFGLFWDNLYILWKSLRYISPRVLKIYALNIGGNCRRKYQGNRKEKKKF